MLRGDDRPFIDRELIDRVDWIMEDSILHDDTWKVWERKHQEDMDLSEWGRILQNMTKPEFAVAVIVAMENYPFMVLQIVAEYLVEERKRKRKNEDSKDV